MTKGTKEFIDKHVNIEYIGISDCFGHYPFSIFTENKDGSFTFGALALGGNVAECYKTFSKEISNGAKRVYMALDFPIRPDINNDFLCIFSYEKEQLSLLVIPYNEQTGDTLPFIKYGETIDSIKEQIERYLV